MPSPAGVTFSTEESRTEKFFFLPVSYDAAVGDVQLTMVDHSKSGTIEREPFVSGDAK